MSHQQEISRANPTCFLFLIDQSSSMDEGIRGATNGLTKKDFVADALNKTLRSLVIRASKGLDVRRYYQVGVVGYGATVAPKLAGRLAGQNLAWIDEINANPLRIETRTVKRPDGAGGYFEVPEKFPIWFQPEANGATPMCSALRLATTLLTDWVRQHPSSYPPTVINLTDGEANDGDPLPFAQTLKALRTSDGNVTLWTLHVSASNFGSSLVFPSDRAYLPDDYSRRMFDMSSDIPANPQIRAGIQELGIRLANNAKAMVFNAGIEEVVNTLDIGTRQSNVPPMGEG